MSDPLDELGGRSARSEIARLHVFERAAGVPVFIHDEGVILDVNDAFCTTVGRTRDQLVGIPAADLMQPLDSEQALFKSHTSETRVQDVGITAADGRVLTREGTGRPSAYGGRRCRSVRLLDIDARLEAERAVRESERELRA